ncbi:MAG: VCBS repeat-containing protein, partial [Pyrinomonadaceae bacterium]|nr:VCBS repeat-containing protein [Pyrinomonadaceae bacterium]
NLLDFFDATVDKQGRVLIGIADGCVKGCAQAPNTAKGNSYSQVSSIIRQAGGRGLFSEYDNVLLSQQSIPAAPFITTRRNGTTTRLTWSEANDGGTPITNYKVYRRTYVGGDQLLATVPGNTVSYNDTTADPNVLYLYRVSATNIVGESCGNNEVVAVPAGNSCTGYRIINDQPSDQTGAPGNRDLDIQNISISEPYMNGANKLVFKLKVASLCQILPNRQWRLIWNYPVPPDPSTTEESVSAFAGRYYVGMTTNAQGAVSFDYGIVTNVDASPASTQTPSRLGDADAGSNFNPDGTITIVISNNKVGNPGAGDIIGGLLGRTFAGQGDITVRSTAAADSSSVALADTYLLVGNAACQNFVPPATTIPKPIIADFDADTLSDVAVFRPQEGNWYFSNSFGSQGVRQWGLASDKITPGDFDGDRKTDVAVFREGEGHWYIIQSSANTVRVQGWGHGGDKPVAADYDGDGYTDIAVFRPPEGNWYILGTSTCSSTVQGWGNSTDQPVPADYDGDGKADIAVFRESEGTWYVVRSTGGATVQGWGIGGDIPVPGDYDGDGKADLAVFRPLEGNWYILKSTGGSTVTNWGNASDQPVPADYDGDGKADIAVFRGTEGNWYIIKSSGGTTIRFLGQSGDIPVPLAYRPY